MLPEITQRCASCGASIREPAMFCPECGKALSQPAAEHAEHESHAVVAASAPTTPRATADDKVAAMSQTSTVLTDDQEATRVQPTPPTSAADDSTKKVDSESLPISKTGKYEKARDSLHRASTATREALADNVKRVEKIRHVSSAMIEEAAYDPSLRFVLVALALFVIFLVLLLLSKVMG
ncbi:MAG TPA: zinc ribbon domain-containing protein [Pyrinomonadaceae bacterium]|nr:zinc ribbon domain-containing protein [Pyrinomonadaceae bacterium]